MEFVYGKKEIEQTLKVGDIVFMNDKYKVPERLQGQVFMVRSQVQDICGTPCVFLENYTGAYAVDGLTKATERQKAIYILSLLDDNRFDMLVAQIEKNRANLFEHRALLDDESLRASLSNEERLKWYQDWEEKNRFLELNLGCDLGFFFDLLNGNHRYLYGEPVKGAKK